MKRKKIIKLIFILLMVAILLIPAQIVFADTGIDTSIVETPNTATQSEFDKPGKIIYGAIQGVGIGISVVVLIVIGIKYMVGSVEEKAEYKKEMVPYIIGVIFLTCAASIPNIISGLNLIP